jgi:Arc/MetJ-type ribon-helix-helix transcriptional regulator
MSLTIQVTLDEAQKAWVDAQVAKGRFPNAETVIRTALERERLRAEGNGHIETAHQDIPLSRDEQEAAERLSKILTEAKAEGPLTPMTSQDWQEIRKELALRRQARSAK